MRFIARARPAKASRTSAESCEVSGIPGCMLPHRSRAAELGSSQLPRCSHTMFDRGSLLGDQAIALVDRMAGNRDRVAEYHRDGTRPEERKAFLPKHFARADDYERIAIE